MTLRPPFAWALLTPLAVIASLGVACGGRSASSSMLSELRRVTTVVPGRPVLVFVYTDG